jgi:hypothetical protein
LPGLLLGNILSKRVNHLFLDITFHPHISL